MKQKRRFYNIILRYSLLILLGIPNLFIFYKIFTPLTVYPVYWFFKIFYDASLINNLIIIESALPIEIIKACVAGSAYYLLTILNFSTAKIKLEKRIKLLVFSFASLLAINLMRIVFLGVIFLEEMPGFVAAHEVFWYLLSTLFVVGVWFTGVKIFKIKDIPFYSDLKFLYENSLIKN